MTYIIYDNQKCYFPELFLQDLDDLSHPQSAAPKKSTDSSRPTREQTMASVKSSDDMMPHNDMSGADADLAADYNDDFEGDEGEKGASNSPTQSATEGAKPGEHDITPFVQVRFI